jgi:hypothetical protein
MKSFICSALFIAVALIGQQWVGKSSVADSAVTAAAARGVILDAGYARWMAGDR